MRKIALIGMLAACATTAFAQAPAQREDQTLVPDVADCQFCCYYNDGRYSLGAKLAVDGSADKAPQALMTCRMMRIPGIGGCLAQWDTGSSGTQEPNCKK